MRIIMMMMAFSFMDMKTSLQKNTIRVHWVHFGLACSNNGSCLALHYTVIFLENVFPAKKKVQKKLFAKPKKLYGTERQVSKALSLF